MTWWRAIFLAPAVLVPIACWILGRRDFARSWFVGNVQSVIFVAPIGLGAAIGGSVGAWCVVPLSVAAYWSGRTPLGMLNFVLLQWFGLRLQAAFSREEWLRGPRGRWWAADAPRNGPIAWSLLRWVWPLTGWWSAYRWIRRP